MSSNTKRKSTTIQKYDPGQYHPAIQEYMDIVRNETVRVCKEQVLLCDLVDRAFLNEDIYLDEEQLEKYLALEKYFEFKLFPWEKFVFALHNCVYKADGELRWPHLFILGGRGLGKNGYLAFEDFCLLTPINGVKYYHIDICANAEEQARTTFEDVYQVLENNKAKLKMHFTWTKEKIENIKTKSVLRFRTSNAKTKDGGRPGKVDFDEEHAYEDYKSINVFKTGLGKKKHPRTTTVTTNGDVRDGPLDHHLERAEQILNGEIPDNGFLPFICKLDDKEEVHDVKNWDKANPSLQYLPNLRTELLNEYEDFKFDNLGNSSFMTKRMNVPMGNVENEVTSWDNILATKRDIPNLSGKTGVFGIDSASTNDFFSAGILFYVDEVYYWITHSWVCKHSADLGRIKYPIREAESNGLLTIVDSQEIDEDLVVSWIDEQASKYNIIVGGLDLYRYSLIKKRLAASGFIYDKKEGNLKTIRPSDIMIAAPKITRVFNQHKIVWGDNSLMRWYVNNAKKVLDSKGNISYGKIEPKSRKTDGFMAMVAAFCCSDILEELAESNTSIAHIDLSPRTY